MTCLQPHCGVEETEVGVGAVKHVDDNLRGDDDDDDDDDDNDGQCHRDR